MHRLMYRASHVYPKTGNDGSRTSGVYGGDYEGIVGCGICLRGF